MTSILGGSGEGEGAGAGSAWAATSRPRATHSPNATSARLRAVPHRRAAPLPGASNRSPWGQRYGTANQDGVKSAAAAVKKGSSAAEAAHVEREKPALRLSGGLYSGMSLRRLVVIVLSTVGALVLAIVLYLAFGDLSRHKGRIEAFVTKKTGRPFAIDGAFELKVLPSISVDGGARAPGQRGRGARRRRWSRSGRFATEIGLWSLVSGPVDVRSLELGDVSVLLEKGKDGKGNWVLGERDEARGRAARCGLARPGRDRGPGRHPQRHSQQRACHLSRARQAGPRRAPRDAHHRARARPTSWRSPARAGSAGTRPR